MRPLTSRQGLHPRRALPASRHTPFENHSAFNHPTPSIAAFSRYPSARWISLPRVQASPLASRLAGHVRPNQVRHPADWSSRLRLLPTPSRDDAVTFGYRPESVCLKRTCTSLSVCARRRTSPGRQPGVGRTKNPPSPEGAADGRGAQAPQQGEASGLAPGAAAVAPSGLGFLVFPQTRGRRACGAPDPGLHSAAPAGLKTEMCVMVWLKPGATCQCPSRAHAA